MSDPQIISSRVLCTKCGYDLQGLYFTGKCPECGTDVTQSVPECPRCRASKHECLPLRRAWDSTGAWSCGQCGGVGFEQGFLQRALQAERAQASGTRPKVTEIVSQTAVMCGRCRLPAASIIVDRTVMIERCEGCGFVWLDAEELTAIADYITKTIGGRAVPPHVERVLHDTKQLKIAAKSGADVAGTAAAGVIEVILSIFFG